MLSETIDAHFQEFCKRLFVRAGLTSAALTGIMMQAKGDMTWPAI
jgi:hypothetical protein